MPPGTSTRGYARLQQADLRLEGVKEGAEEPHTVNGPPARSSQDVAPDAMSEGMVSPQPVDVQPHARDRADHAVARHLGLDQQPGDLPAVERDNVIRPADGERVLEPATERAACRTARAAAASHHARSAGRSSRSPDAHEEVHPGGESQSDPCGRARLELAIGDHGQSVAVRLSQRLPRAVVRRSDLGVDLDRVPHPAGTCRGGPLEGGLGAW